MMIIPNSNWLVKDDKESIRKKSVDVKLPLSKEDELVMQKMISFVKFSQDKVKNKNKILNPAVGIAAPQIGSNINMYYIKLDKKIDQTKKNIEYALINPRIVGKINQVTALENGEGCLSAKIQKPGLVHRSYKVIVEAYDYLTKKEVKLIAKGYEAIVIQHEQEHLEGKLYYDHIDQNDPWKIIENAIYL